VKNSRNSLLEGREELFERPKTLLLSLSKSFYLTAPRLGNVAIILRLISQALLFLIKIPTRRFQANGKERREFLLSSFEKKLIKSHRFETDCANQSPLPPQDIGCTSRIVSTGCGTARPT
jgi:hypothetical protein